MPPFAQNIRSARAAVERILDEMGLDAYAYMFEPRQDGWMVLVECATGEGCQQAVLPVDPRELDASVTDSAVRVKLSDTWDSHLCACARRVASAIARWEHYEHSADIGVRGIGATRSEAFEQAAVAMTAVATDPGSIEPREWVTVECEAPDEELLLAEWLNALVLDTATRKMLFSRFLVRIDGTRLRGAAWGEPIDVARHHPAAEVKGATYTTLRVAREGDAWVAQTVVDV